MLAQCNRIRAYRKTCALLAGSCRSSTAEGASHFLTVINHALMIRSSPFGSLRGDRECELPSF